MRAGAELPNESLETSFPVLPKVTTEAIREASRCMTALLHEAGAGAAESCKSGEHWRSCAQAAMDGMVRRSIEMRLVVRPTQD